MANHYTKYPRTPEERFWAKVNKHSGKFHNGVECWEWTASTVMGYGQFWPAKRTMVYAHRFAYQLRHGPIPAGLQVCHHCDNRLCVRDEHHFLGTHKENAAGSVRKGRSARGEGKPNVKFGEVEVRDIRRRAAAGESHSALAREYGVWRGTISEIVRRLSWKYV